MATSNDSYIKPSNDSPELHTIKQCTPELETALKGCDRDLVHFLERQGFISSGVQEEVLNPQSTLTEVQKAGELVKWIRRRVDQYPRSFQELMRYLKRGGKLYEPIANKLKECFRSASGPSTIHKGKEEHQEQETKRENEDAVPGTSVKPLLRKGIKPTSGRSQNGGRAKRRKVKHKLANAEPMTTDPQSESNQKKPVATAMPKTEDVELHSEPRMVKEKPQFVKDLQASAAIQTIAKDMPDTKARPTKHVNLRRCKMDDATLLIKVIKLHESEVIDCLLENSPDSVLKLVRIAHDKHIVTEEIKTNIESLDPRVHHQLKCRYLMLHAYKYIDQNIGEKKLSACKAWLNALSLVAETASIPSLVTHSYKNPKDVNTSVELVAPASNVCVEEGKSVLLEIQFKGNPKRYQWFKTAKDRLVMTEHHSYPISRDSIMHISAKDLSSEGYYTCRVVNDKEEWDSGSIFLKVDTPIDKYQQFLIDKYTVQPTIPEDTWPPASRAGTYINLALIKQGSIHKAGEYGRCTIRGDMDDIYKSKESITYDEAMGNLSGGACLLIEGRPGSGKTTFVHKLTKDWAKKEDITSQVRLLLLIHLRGFSSDPNIGLKDLVGCYYNGHPGMEDIMKYANQHNGLGLCFILDGLDEYLLQKNSFIFRLIKRQDFPKSLVIVASRPAAAADFRETATRQIEVLGFLKTEIEDYIAKYPFYTKSKCQEIRKYLDEHHNILHMCYLPVHSSMICFIYDNKKEKLPETETEIYETFTKFAMLRTIYRSKELTIESFDDLSQSHKNHFLKICELAFNMTLSSKQVMKQTEVKQICTSLEENQLFGLITVDKMAMMCGFQELYTFLHLTFQEFLAAYHISTLEDAEQMELIKKSGAATHMKQTWKFFCGLVQFNDTGNKFESLVKHAQHGPLFNMQCSFESQQPCTCDSVVGKESLKFSNCFLTPSDFTAMAFVISNTQNICKLEIIDCMMGEEGIDTLVRKAVGDNLALVSTVCYKSSSQQLSVLNKLMHSLPALKLLDLTDTFIKQDVITFIGYLNHPALEILKVSSDLCPPRVAHDIATKLFSCCRNFINLCFSGDINCSDYRSLPLPFLFYCNCKKINISFNQLRPTEVKELSADLILNPQRTTVLSLIGCGIDDKAASCLAEGIKHCKALEILELACNSIGDDGAIALADSILNGDLRLRILNMNCNRICEKGAKFLLQTVNSIPGLNLYLWNNCIPSIMKSCTMSGVYFHTFEIFVKDNIDIHALFFFMVLRADETACQDLKHCILHSFNISSSRIGNSVSVDLAKSSIRCSNLTLLNFSNNTISENDIRELAKPLKHLTNLTTLDLSNNNLGLAPLTDPRDLRVSGASELAKSLMHLTKLTTLNLSGMHRISTTDGINLAKSLVYLTNLTTLNLSGMNIPVSVIHELAQSLVHLTNVSTLNLSGINTISDSGASELAKSLVHLINLTTLNLSGNRITVNGIRELAKSLVHLTNLSTLNLSGIHKISNSGIRELAKRLVHLTNLTTLDLSDNGITESGACERLVHHTNLKTLNLRGNRISDIGAIELAKSWNNNLTIMLD